MMGRTCVLVILAVCVLWTFGETLSCDQCGRECMPSCGTRQFRACCFNNLRKRTPDLGFKLWVAPPRESVCVLWTFGETLACDQCGDGCVSSCGTRKFHLCCFNNQVKRTSNLRFRLGSGSARKSGGQLRIIYKALVASFQRLVNSTNSEEIRTHMKVKKQSNT